MHRSRLSGGALVVAYVTAILLIDRIVGDDMTQIALAAGVSAASGAAVGRWWILFVPPGIALLLLVHASLTQDLGGSEGGFPLAATLAVLYAIVGDACVALGLAVRRLGRNGSARKRPMPGSSSGP